MSLFVFLGSQNAMHMHIAATCEVDNWEGMPEPALHIPRWPLSFVVMVSIFLNKRPQRGRDWLLWKRGRNPMTRHR